MWVSLQGTRYVMLRKRSKMPNVLSNAGAKSDTKSSNTRATRWSRSLKLLGNSLQGQGLTKEAEVPSELNSSLIALRNLDSVNFSDTEEEDFDFATEQLRPE